MSQLATYGIAGSQLKTPFRPDPMTIHNGAQFEFDPPLDEGIRDIVMTLVSAGVETFESCEGGRGHAFPCPTVRFEGSSAEGLRALSVALANGLPVADLRRVWGVVDGVPHGPWWEMTFTPPRDSQIWEDRDTSVRYSRTASVPAD